MRITVGSLLRQAILIGKIHAEGNSEDSAEVVHLPQAIPVGRPVTRPPPHRSPRAELPHGAFHSAPEVGIPRGTEPVDDAS